MAISYKEVIIFGVARCLIGASIGLVFDIPGAIAGGIIAAFAWPMVRRVAWAVCQLHGGTAEPEQSAYFWSWRRQRDNTTNEPPQNNSSNQ